MNEERSQNHSFSNTYWFIYYLPGIKVGAGERDMVPALMKLTA